MHIMTGLFLVNSKVEQLKRYPKTRKCKYQTNRKFRFSLQVVYMFYNPTDSGAVQLKSDNLDMTLGNFEENNLHLLHLAERKNVRTHFNLCVQKVVRFNVFGSSAAQNLKSC